MSSRLMFSLGFDPSVSSTLVSTARVQYERGSDGAGFMSDPNRLDS